MIIQIIGLPGSGKTFLAKALKERINAIHLNADEVRATVNSDLGFTKEDRIEQARRMGEMARLIANQGVAPVIVDFVCPTKETREAFGKPDILVYMYTIQQGRFEDTNKMFKSHQNMTLDSQVIYLILIKKHQQLSISLVSTTGLPQQH